MNVILALAGFADPPEPEPVGPAIWLAVLHSLPAFAFGSFIVLLRHRPPVSVIDCRCEIQIAICGAAILCFFASLSWSFCNGVAPLLAGWFFGDFG